jgi:4-amino-4-deoxy-L-arabinose transferase-like glycosyltransferase
LPTATSASDQVFVPRTLVSSRLAALFDEVAVSRTAYLAGTALFAFALRLVVVACVFRIVAAPTVDHNEFGWEMGWTARSIVLGHGFSSPFLPFTGPTALVPPLYPYLIAGIEKLFGLYTAKSAFVILSLNSIFSALTAIPIYFGARTVLRERVARAAALLWAVYPFSVYFSADRVWDYALTGLLLSLGFCLSQTLHRRGMAAWAGFGALCGVAALSNPSVLSVLAPAGLIAIYRWKQISDASLQELVQRAVCGALVALAVCIPWAIRNQRTFHQPTFIRDGFWLEFWAGNNGDTFESNPGWAHPASNPQEMTRYQAVSEPEYMAQKRALAVEFVEHHPAFFAMVSLRRLFCFWTGFWSADAQYINQDPTEIPDLFYCSTMTLLALWGARRWWQEDRLSALPYIAAITLFPLAYVVTHSSPDYRQPIEPIIVVLALVGLFGPTSNGVYATYIAEPLEREMDQDGVVAAT